MDITVILCPYNRSQSLANTLESLGASLLPESIGWEVLVVDNNSTDQTRQVVEDFCSRHPKHFRYLFELKAGKSHALNAGVSNAHSEILAFTDDDVTVEPSWLRNLTAPLGVPGWAGIGGRTLPASSFSPPLWLPLGGPMIWAGYSRSLTRAKVQVNWTGLRLVSTWLFVESCLRNTGVFGLI